MNLVIDPAAKRDILAMLGKANDLLQGGARKESLALLMQAIEATRRAHALVMEGDR